MASRRAVFPGDSDPSTADRVEGLSLSPQGLEDIHGSGCSPPGMFNVRGGGSLNVLEEYSDHIAGCFVDRTRESLDSSNTMSQATD